MQDDHSRLEHTWSTVSAGEWSSHSGWRHLVTDDVCDEPFFQSEWFAAFAQCLEPNVPSEVLTLSSGTQVRGVLPLVPATKFFKRIPAATLRSLSGIHSCRFDLVHARSDRDMVIEAAWKALAQKKRWEVIEALDVPLDGAFMQLLEAAKGDGYLVGLWPTRKSPYLILPAASGEPFANCPDHFKSFRARLKSKRKKLATQGQVGFRSITTADDQVLEEFFALEASGWKGANGSAIRCSTPLLTYYKKIARWAASCGALRMYRLSIDAQPIAMHFGLVMNGTYFAPKVAYDEGYGKSSPGQLLVHEVIRDLHGDGIRRYDFLGPRALWKSVWTDTVREHSNCYIFRPTFKGRVLHFLTMKAARLARRLKTKVRGDPQELDGAA